MSTCMKGMGAFRKQLLLEIIDRFGRDSFSYKEASTLPVFDRSTFMTLYHDRLLKKASQGFPLRYSIISRSVDDIKNHNNRKSTVDRSRPLLDDTPRGGGTCSEQRCVQNIE